MSGGVDGEAADYRSACVPSGERLINLSRELPRGLQFMDFVVSVEPFPVIYLSAGIP
jgi:hypothetical protein